MSQDSSSSSKPGKASPTKVDPEVKAKPERRKFSAEYKRRILEEADACTEAALFFRKELYFSSTAVPCQSHYFFASCRFS